MRCSPRIAIVCAFRLDLSRSQTSPRNTQSPLCVLEGHTDAVTAVCWPNVLAIYSGSHDHAIKQWDASAAACVRTWHGKQVVTAIDFSLLNNSIATGHNDKVVRVLDPRSKDGDVVKLAFSSHQQWVSSVAWSTVDPQLLASASFDGPVKMWDIRSTVPLHTLSAHSDKALAVDFCAGGGAGTSGGVASMRLVSGGSDRQLQTHQIAASVR